MPESLAGITEEGLRSEMLALVTDTLDKSEGSFVWDMIAPCAAELAKVLNCVLPDALKSMFPRWAEGDKLDLHAQLRGLQRRDAACAVLRAVFTGTDGTVIPRGTVLLTASGVQAFRTLSPVTIADGEGETEAEALVAGLAGHAAAGTVCRMERAIAGVTGVTNPQAASGGSDRESDESLRERILAFDAGHGSSRVGSAADYRRWAQEVAGVGSVRVEGGSGTVTLIITDADGGPASQALQNAVYAHIMSPDVPEERLAPVNAGVTVRTYEMQTVTVEAAIETDGTSLETIARELAARLKTYYASITDGVVRLTRVGALLSGIAGVTDFSELTLNGEAENLAFAAGDLPETTEDDITLTAGEGE